MFGQPTKSIAGLYQCTKFRWNLCRSFDNMQVLIFNEFGLKIPMHATKMEGLGIMPRKWEQPYCDPQRAPPCVQMSCDVYIVKIGPIFLHSYPFITHPKSYALQWVIYSPKSTPFRGSIRTPI